MSQNIKFTALDRDAQHVDFVRRFSNEIYFGDATRLDLLQQAHAESADLLIIAVDDMDDSLKLAHLAGESFPNLKVVARARNRLHAYELMEADMLKQRENQVANATTQQIINHLNSNLEFELPKDMVMREAQGRINQIVRENAQRGLGDDTIQEHQDEILNSATADAHASVKNTFILEAIAKKEEIKVDNDELRGHVEQMAAANGMPFEKVAKQLEKDGDVQRIHHQLLMSKTLDFLKSNASVETLSLEELQAAEAAQQA